VFVEYKLFPLLDAMKLTCSYYDYMKMQSDVNWLIPMYDRNQEKLKMLSQIIESL
jgi:hypothetical protein